MSRGREGSLWVDVAFWGDPRLPGAMCTIPWWPGRPPLRESQGSLAPAPAPTPAPAPPLGQEARAAGMPSTSFNFTKYFLTGSSKPSPIYISSYSSPAREQNRRLQVNLQYHFYRRSFSRDGPRKGPGCWSQQGRPAQRGRGASPGHRAPQKLVCGLSKSLPQ